MYCVTKIRRVRSLARERLVPANLLDGNEIHANDSVHLYTYGGPQLSGQNQKPHGKNKIPHVKTENLTAKTKTSRQNQKPHGKNKIPHDKTKNLTAKPKPHGKNKIPQAKPNTSQQKQNSFGFAVGICFCREVFGFECDVLLVSGPRFWPKNLNFLL